MNTLSIDLGVNEYQLAPDCIVRFNPTDQGFIGRLFDAFSELDKLDNEYKGKVSGLKEPRDILDCFSEYDTRMRAVIDGVFDVPVCQAVFGDIRVSALSGNGVPVWVEFFLIIIDQLDLESTGLQGKGKKYMDKYSKKYLK